MPAERGGAARFDCPHRPQLLEREVVGGPVGRPVLSEDAGKLEGLPHGYFFFAFFGVCPSVSKGLVVAPMTAVETRA